MTMPIKSSEILNRTSATYFLTDSALVKSLVAVSASMRLRVSKMMLIIASDLRYLRSSVLNGLPLNLEGDRKGRKF